MPLRRADARPGLPRPFVSARDVLLDVAVLEPIDLPALPPLLPVPTIGLGLDMSDDVYDWAGEHV